MTTHRDQYPQVSEGGDLDTDDHPISDHGHRFEVDVCQAPGRPWAEHLTFQTVTKATDS